MEKPVRRRLMRFKKENVEVEIRAVEIKMFASDKEPGFP